MIFDYSNDFTGEIKWQILHFIYILTFIISSNAILLLQNEETEVKNLINTFNLITVQGINQKSGQHSSIQTSEI